jgi:large subunit ribosomal protein L37Ae
MKYAGGIKRFGARYGLSVKKKPSKIEALQKSDTKCPYCGYSTVKRLAVGIYACSKCMKKFTGKAYTISREVVQEEAASEEEKKDGSV